MQINFNSDMEVACAIYFKFKKYRADKIVREVKNKNEFKLR